MSRMNVVVSPTEDQIVEASVEAIRQAREPGFSGAGEFKASDVLRVTAKKLSENGGIELTIQLEGGFAKFIAASIREQT